MSAPMHNYSLSQAQPQGHGGFTQAPSPGTLVYDKENMEASCPSLAEYGRRRPLFHNLIEKLKDGVRSGTCDMLTEASVDCIQKEYSVAEYQIRHNRAYEAQLVAQLEAVKERNARSEAFFSALHRDKLAIEAAQDPLGDQAPPGTIHCGINFGLGGTPRHNVPSASPHHMRVLEMAEMSMLRDHENDQSALKNLAALEKNLAALEKDNMEIAREGRLREQSFRRFLVLSSM